MKKIFVYTILSLFSALSVLAYSQPESIVFDKTTKSYFISNTANGDIIQVLEDGSSSVFCKKKRTQRVNNL